MDKNQLFVIILLVTILSAYGCTAAIPLIVNKTLGAGFTAQRLPFQGAPSSLEELQAELLPGSR